MVEHTALSPVVTLAIWIQLVTLKKVELPTFPLEAMSVCWGSLDILSFCLSSCPQSPPSLPRDLCGPAVLTQSCQVGDKN